MRKYILILLFLTVITLPSCGAKKQKYVVGFYNVENLFDIVDNPDKNDEDFLPGGYYKWTKEKYLKKQHNIARAIKAMADANGAFHSVLGIAEVENKKVLEDLVSQPEIAKARYEIVHSESPDPRGIDVAFLYRPDHFKLLETETVHFKFVQSRDVLVIRGLLGGEMFAFMVAHLSSRIGGKGTDTRLMGAEAIHKKAVQLMKDYPGIKIVIMGDMNDDPVDESMVKGLHGKEFIADLGEDDFFSPFYSMLKAGYGSMEYKGTWQIFDQILVNKSTTEGKGLKIQKIEDNKFYGKVFKPDFLIQQSGRYKGTPLRTFSSGEFLDGFSDHLPTYIILSK